MTSAKLVIHPLESIVGEDSMVALARFRILTVLQLVAVTGRDEKTLRGRLNQLVTAGYVRPHEFRYGHMSGRLRNAYSLTAKGVKWVGGGFTPVSNSKKLSISMAPHRELIIDTLISADSWARQTGQTSPVFRIDKAGDGTSIVLPSKTADADAVIELADTQGRRRVYVVEVYCDYLDNANSKPFEKLTPYITAGTTTALDVALGIIPAPGVKNAMVLVVCDSPEMRDRLVKGLPKRESLPPLSLQTWKRFLFKTNEQLADFGTGWHRVDGTQSDLPL